MTPSHLNCAIRRLVEFELKEISSKNPLSEASGILSSAESATVLETNGRL
jgi:hypothetical protein